MSVTSLIKAAMPRAITRQIVDHRLRQDLKRSAGKSREAVFTEIYEQGLWGKGADKYCSGTGSHSDVLQPYIDLVQDLIRTERVNTVVDIGCGDFEVGRRIASPAITYIGCDIFPGVISSNTAKFGSDRVQFKRLDAVTDVLPDADLMIIRQVFQHLSNDDITAILGNCSHCPLLLVTDEQVRSDDAAENINLPPYHGTRRLYGQGLRLERAPFLQSVEVLLEHSSGAGYGDETGTYLRTTIVRKAASPKC